MRKGVKMYQEVDDELYQGLKRADTLVAKLIQPEQIQEAEDYEVDIEWSDTEWYNHDEGEFQPRQLELHEMSMDDIYLYLDSLSNEEDDVSNKAVNDNSYDTDIESDNE